MCSVGAGSEASGTFWSTPGRCPFKIPVILNGFSAENFFGPLQTQKSPCGFNWRFSNLKTFVKKNDFFFKVWGAASIGDAATIRNFTVTSKTFFLYNKHVQFCFMNYP